jgi:hypothetical protein
MKLRHKIFFITIGLLALIILFAILWLNYRNVVINVFNYALDRKTLINLLRHQGKHNAVLFMAVIAIGSAIPGVPIAAVAIYQAYFLDVGLDLVSTFLESLLVIY